MKPVIKNSAKVVGAAAYTLVFAELFVRIMDPVALMPRYVTGAEDGVRRNIPGAVYWQTTPEVRVQIRINSQGLRADREYALTPPENTCRLALFGDSFFMGYEVSLEESVAGKLEQGLEERGYQVEVMNFAVSGFGSAENLVALKDRALQYSPDMVIFEWHSSDIDDDTRAQLFKLENGELVRDRDAFLPAIETRDFLMQFAVYRWLIGNSHLYSFAREKAAEAIKGLLVRVRRIGAAKAEQENVAETEQSPASAVAVMGGQGGEQPAQRERGGEADAQQAQVSQEARRSYAILKRAQQLSREAGAGFILADVPKRHGRTRFQLSSSRLPEEVFQEFRVANPIAKFEQHAGPDTKIYYEKGHFHLTPLGNQLVVDSIIATLLEEPAGLGHCRRYGL